MGWVGRYVSPETGAHVQLVTRDATSPEDSVVSVTTNDVDAAYAEAQGSSADADEFGACAGSSPP